MMFFNDLSPGAFLNFFWKNTTLWILKFLQLLRANFNSFFNKQLFFKLINKCQTEIKRYAPPSSYLCYFWFTVLGKSESFQVRKRSGVLTFKSRFLIWFSGSSDFSRLYFLISFLANETEHRKFIIAVDDDLPEVCALL